MTAVRTVLWTAIFLLYIQTFVNLTEIPVCSNGGQDSSEVTTCCPCYHGDQNASCLATACSDDYHKMELSSNDTCQSLSDDMPETNTTVNPVATDISVTTATDENDNTTSSGGNDTEATTKAVPKEFKCIKKECLNDKYFDETITCADCDPCMPCNNACIGCTGPAASDCKKCKYIKSMKDSNRECVAKCPDDNFELKNETDANNQTSQVKVCVSEENDKNTIYYIAGGAGGGGLVVVIIIIVVVVVCCKRRGSHETRTNKKTGRTAMSTLLENKKHGVGTNAPEGVDNPAMGGSDSRIHNYENQTSLPSGKTLTLDVQRKQEQVTRYTRDPTLKHGQQPPQEEPGNRDTLYENAAMVKLMRNTDITHASEEHLQNDLELVEIEDLGEAPQTPRHPGQVDVVVPRPKKKKSIAKRLSQRMVKTLQSAGNKRGKPANPEPYQQDDYLDMDVHGPGAPGANAGPGASTEVDQPTYEATDDNLEDYENTSTLKRKAKPLPAEPAPETEEVLEDYENGPANLRKTGIVSAKSKVKTNAEELEDYENAPASLRKTGIVSGKSAENTNEKNDHTEDLEDYENAEQYKKSKKEQKGDDNSGQFKVTGPETAEVDGQGDNSELEDYENSEQYKKMNEENPYENVQFGNK